MKHWRLIALTGGLVFATSAYGDPSAKEIIKKGETILRGKTTQALMMMTIRRPDYTRVLKMRSWTVGNGRALVEILDPPKERGVASLRVDGSMWNYLPKVDQVVRVPTSLMLQSWMGSDFTNDDLMKSSSLARDYRHKKIKQQTIRGQKTVLIECSPLPEAPVVWGRVHYWARTKDWLPVQQKFFDEDGKWARTLSFDGFQQMDDRIVPTRVRVETAEDRKSRTEVRYAKVLYDRAIDSALFSKGQLRRHAQKGRVLTAGWSFARLPGQMGRHY